MPSSPRGPNGVDLLFKTYRQLPPAAQRVVLILALVVGLIVGGVMLVQKFRSPATETIAASPPPTPARPQPLPPARAEPDSKPPTANNSSAPARPAGAVLPHLALGNPSQATPDPANADNFLILKPYFALSYNDKRGTANWVSWQLTMDDIRGYTPRAPGFEPDPDLPPTLNAVVERDYTGSGFNRGHICPHADRDSSEVASRSTFVMTNVMPQAPDLDPKAWANLENDARNLVREGKKLLILAGPAGRGGEGSRGAATSVGRGRVAVPAFCWKIIVVLPAKAQIKDITPRTRVISVMMPNRQGVGEEWPPYLCTPADIEKATGLRFFTALPPAVADALRQQRDSGVVNSPSTSGLSLPAQRSGSR